MNPESNRPIEIEDLLRLKRAERPPAEFWNEFDRQLRTKQLAAIVAKRPWWQSLPRVFSRVSRYHVPLGATAVLAVGFVVVREFRPGTSPSREVVVEHSVAAHSLTAVVNAPLQRPTEVRVQSSADGVAIENGATAAAMKTTDASARVTLTSDATIPGELSHIIPLLGASGGETAQDGTSVVPQYVASSLTPTSTAEPVLSRGLLAATNAFEARTLPRAAVEPLHQITPPGERTRARLLTAMVSRPVVDTRARTTEDVGSRLREERLYDQVRRFGAHGAGLNIKL